MNQHLDLVTKEQAVRLKACGFDWPTYGFFSETMKPGEIVWLPAMVDHNSAGILSCTEVATALKWARSKDKGYYAEIRIHGFATMFEVVIFSRGGIDLLKQTFDTYEAAESAALDHILSLMEERK